MNKLLHFVADNGLVQSLLAVPNVIYSSIASHTVRYMVQMIHKRQLSKIFVGKTRKKFCRYSLVEG